MKTGGKENAYLITRILPFFSFLLFAYLLSISFAIHINAVALTIVLMIIFCLSKMPVAIALLSAALLGGLHAGLSFEETINAFNDNLLIGAQVGITYVMIGAFAVALSRSGLLELLAKKLVGRLHHSNSQIEKGLKWTLFLIFIVASLASQNIVPVHIAFIPILIPPLLGLMNRLQLDRRAVACILACSISASYLLLPIGFGAIYLEEILLANMNEIGQVHGIAVTANMAPQAMFWPVMGIVAGMFFAIFVTYRKPRQYNTIENTETVHLSDGPRISPVQLMMTIVAIIVALVCQILFDSLLIGGMSGFIILSFTGIFKWQQQDDVFTKGVQMMMQIAVIMTIASGFAGVLTATGDIEPLVKSATGFIGNNQLFGVAMMLIVGLFITIGFGDSFASVPILAPIYIPLAVALGFSPLACMAILGASAALGDAGSPASTITLGATAGLNADGQHDHIKDSVIPTFFHANFGMILFTWIAVAVMS
ncbi:MAG: sodium:proton antiporter [Deltaproteobacteria bacterium]|nr:MAG: sodium:proton antiporter [Deltaproteobacteria bacterium]